MTKDFFSVQPTGVQSSNTGRASDKATKRRKSSGILILGGLNISAFAATLVVAALHHPQEFSIFSNVDPEILRSMGGNYGPDTLGGQYWRIFTSIFLHASIWHLLANTVYLIYFVAKLKHFLSDRFIVTLYLIIGSVGAIFSVWFQPTMIIVGASGAVLGLAGVLISLITLRKNDEPRKYVTLWITIIMVAFPMLAGLFSKIVDNSAHFIGFTSGLILGALVAWSFQSAEARFVRQRKLVFSSLFLITLLFVTVIALRGDVIESRRGRLALNAHDPHAITHYQNYIAKYPNDLNGHLQLAYTYSQFNQDELAVEEYRRVVQLDPHNIEAQYNLAREYYLLNRMDDAVGLFRESVPKLPPDGDKYYNFALALVATAQMSEAEVAAEKAVSLSSDSARNHLLLARILLALGKIDQASAERDLAQRLGKPN